MAWTTPRTWTAGELVTAAYMNANVRDNPSALQAGDIALTKVQLDGAASDPGVSASGDATLAYNTTRNALRVSKNAAAYFDLGESGIGDWLFMAGGM